jgi:hypothetical protein
MLNFLREGIVMQSDSLSGILLGSILGLCLFMALLTAHQAQSHVHVEPDGSTVSWYPKECCHDEDCQPVATVRVSPQGLWMTTIRGQTILVGSDEPRRQSPDMRWHICLGLVGHNDIGIQCLFEPPSM